MKNLIQLMTLIYLILTSSCASTKYHRPIELSQTEISSMRVTDSHNNEVPLSPGKIRDCRLNAVNGSTDCTITICKEDTSMETKLKCEMHVPESEKMKTTAIRPISLVTDSIEFNKIETSLNDYNLGKKQTLQNYCLQDTVVCYLNRKFYPESKFASQFNMSTIIHKSSHNLKLNSKIEITVYKPR
jgi:hypothetical protein